MMAASPSLQTATHVAGEAPVEGLRITASGLVRALTPETKAFTGCVPESFQNMMVPSSYADTKASSSRASAQAASWRLIGSENSPDMTTPPPPVEEEEVEHRVDALGAALHHLGVRTGAPFEVEAQRQAVEVARGHISLHS